MIIDKIQKFLKKILPKFIQAKLKKKYYFKSYPNYKSALSDTTGYQDETLVKVIIAKTLKFKEDLKKNYRIDQSLLKIFPAVAASLNSDKLTVLDFGGSAGIHYFIVRSILEKEISLDWRVIETPKMVQEAIKNKLENKELTFYDNLNTAVNEKKIDLAIAIGSIHYTDSPNQILEQILKTNPSYFFLSRTPLAKNELVLLQETFYSKNGVGKIPEELKIDDQKISYPVTILKKDKVETILNNFGKNILSIDEEKSVYKSKDESYDLFGYLFKKNK